MPDATSPDLLDNVRQKRQQLDRFLKAAVPRKRRLLNVSIVAGALAAVLTAAPAVGGQPFTAWLTGLLGLASPSWRLLCGIAAGCSVMASVATQLLKSNQLEERVVRALGCRAKLEILEIGITAGHLDTSRATVEYMQCVQDAAFLDS